MGLDLSTITLADLADAIADAIVAKTGGSQPPAETTPAETNDAPSRTPRPGKGAKKEEPPPAEQPAADDEGDKVTDEQVEFVQENMQPSVDEKDLDEIKSELTDYYVALGNEKKEVAKTISATKEKALREDYAEYAARLVSEADGKMDFLSDFDTPYPATRINPEGDAIACWIKGGVTLDDAAIKEADLGDAEAAMQAQKKGPAKKTPGKK